MLAMVEYGEPAGSGLQGIFKTWETVYHRQPELTVTSSGGVDRTTLTLDFEGRAADIEAMKSLYGATTTPAPPSATQESTQEPGHSTPETAYGTQESKGKGSPETPSKGESKGESRGESSPKTPGKGESKGEGSPEIPSKGESKGEGPSTTLRKGEDNRERVLTLLSTDGKLTLPAIAAFLGLSLAGVEKIVRQLKAEGLLSRKGSTKAGEWVVHEKR